MTSSVAIGREFEQKYVDILKVKNVQVERTGGRGDKGIDMRGRIHGENFVGQCKAWRKNKIDDRRGGGLTKDSFTSDAVKAAEKAGIIITDSDHL
ncbi:7542_t:CDS:2 [Funneliformis caledonium]|uniref:7542_t:CDS:1 n=1 Tax=Funneliformis caledonium TaxID=1117310 RepID=A0A9N9EWF9_9GLOM|nr:7542_t:CDS:2 [Funneliformis caledonium]